MKLQVRRSTFETNSSSTHSLTMVDYSDYTKFKNGEYVFDTDCDELVPLEVAKAEFEADPSYWDNFSDRYKTFDEYWDESDYETFSQEFTTKNGDKVIGFGYYGYC